MSDTIFNIDFTRALPPALKNDKSMSALAEAIAGELQTTARLSRLNLIYARIDELGENLLDTLAYDFNITWYKSSYPAGVKRQIVKDGIKVHKTKGTKYSVETALRALYPKCKITEWFEYGGEPGTFKIDIDVTDTDIKYSPKEIKKTVEYYKRLTAHLEKIAYNISTSFNPDIYINPQLALTGMFYNAVAADVAAGILTSLKPDINTNPVLTLTGGHKTNTSSISGVSYKNRCFARAEKNFYDGLMKYSRINAESYSGYKQRKKPDYYPVKMEVLICTGWEIRGTAVPRADTSYTVSMGTEENIQACNTLEARIESGTDSLARTGCIVGLGVEGGVIIEKHLRRFNGKTRFNGTGKYDAEIINCRL